MRENVGNPACLWFTKEAIKKLHKNTNSTVQIANISNTDFFEVVTGVFQENTLAPYLFIVCLEYTQQISRDVHSELGLTFTKSRSSRYTAKHLSDVDYTDNLTLIMDDIYDRVKLLRSVQRRI